MSQDRGPRTRTVLAGTAVSFLVVWLGLFLASGSARLERAHEDCYAVQSQLASVLVMWKVEEGPPPERFEPAAFAGLVQAGYLDALPVDPGYGAGSEEHFRMGPGSSVFCLRHGRRTMSDESPREWLRSLEGAPPDLVEEAAAAATDNPGHGNLLGLPGAIETIVLLVTSPALGLLLAVGWARLGAGHEA